MSDFRFQALSMLNLLWVIPLLALLLWVASRRRRDAAARFIVDALQKQMGESISAGRRRWKTIALLAGLIFLVIGLTRPAWNPQPEVVHRRGRDVVFLLDVSKSMLAEDLKPNRLERAKLAILDCVERIHGDRVGLVAFAGTAAVKCPLTIDYGFFRLMLDGLTPESVTRGGTLLGDALRKTMEDVFDEQNREFKDIILITDGEDHESFPAEAALAAGEAGIRILAIGLGSESEGQPIPVSGPSGKKQFLTYNGEEVRTRLDADTLREMARVTPGGKYLNVATGSFDLGDIYTRLVAAAEKRQLESRTVDRYQERFQVFLAVSFLLFCVEMAASDRRRGGPP